MIKFNRLVVIGSKPSSLYNFRGDLIKRFVKLGFDVIGLAPQATNEESSQNKCNKSVVISYDRICHLISNNSAPLCIGASSSNEKGIVDNKVASPN